MKQAFDALLQSSPDGMDAAFVSIPYNVQKIHGTRGQVKVKATFDGYDYRGVIANMGTGSHIIGVRKDIRKAIGKKAGDLIHVTIEEDTAPRLVEVPKELQLLLDKNGKASAVFNSLSYTNRKEYALWIASAKKDETKKMRLSKILGMLLKGMKNPSDKR